MKHILTKNDDSSVTVSLDISKDDLSKAEEVVVKEYPELKPDEIAQNAQEMAILRAFQDALAIEGLIPYTEPKIKHLGDEPFKVELSFVPKPEVQVPDYKELTFKKEEAKEVSDSDVDVALQMMLRNMSNTEKVTRPIETEDMVYIDFEAKSDSGEVVMKGKNRKFYLGVGMLMPQIEEQIIGLKAGDSKKFKTEFKGDELDFVIDIKDVFSVDIPDVNDELAVKVMGEGSNVEKLKSELKNDIAKRNDEIAAKNNQESVLKAIVKSVDIVVPELLIDNEVEHMKMMIKENAKSQGKNPEEVKFPDEIRKHAADNVVLRLAMSEFLKADEFKVDDDEVDALMDSEISHYSPADQEKVREAMSKDPNLKNSLRSQIQTQKFFKVVLG